MILRNETELSIARLDHEYSVISGSFKIQNSFFLNPSTVFQWILTDTMATIQNGY